MDHNYTDTPLLTSSDYESIMEDLKPENFADFGSPFRLDQNVTYGDPMINPVRASVPNIPTQGLIPPPPPLEEYGPLGVQELQGHGESVHTTTPPEMSPSLSSTGTIPSRDDYPGLLDFEIQLASTTSSKSSWLYSHQLNKVFIDMQKSLMIQFRVKDFMNGLFVRALPVYEQDDYIRVPVERCGLHAISDDPHGRAHPESEPGACYCPNYFMVRHVLLSSDPQARYDYNSESDRHSVVVPLQAPHPGSGTTTVEYQFACKTSCPRGMNRKPIVVIFTLENEQCQVLGRMVLPVKICSCPKRDKEKEEKEREKKEQENKDLVKNGFPPKTKRRLSSTADKQESKKVKTLITTQNFAGQEASSDVVRRLDLLEKKLTEKLELESKLNEKLDSLHKSITEINQKLNQMEEIDQKLNRMEEIDQKLKRMEELLIAICNPQKPESV